MMKLQGLIAAAYTPMREDRQPWLEQVPVLVDHLFHQGVDGVFICGTTGEGISMTTAERKRVAEAFLQAARGRMTSIMHVGHNCLAETRDLARHAAEHGADAFSAVAPSYFPVTTVKDLVDIVHETASAAPELPFYYYHLPHMTGIDVDVAAFLEQAAEVVPNLAGVKYTSHKVHEFQEAQAAADGRFDLVWGFDEMLLTGLTAGARAAIGTTYNYLAPLYRAIIDAFDQGDLNQARALQQESIRIIRVLFGYPFHTASKAILARLGVDCGPCRRPLPPRLSKPREQQLWDQLQQTRFPDWSALTGHSK